MVARQLARLGWLGIALTAGLAATSVACSKKSSPPAQSATLSSAPVPAAAQTFRFAPPDGTEFVRTDRRRQEYALVGAPLRRVDEDELRWKVRIDKKGDTYRVKQDLGRVSFKRDGKIVAEGEVKKGISAELVIDKDGNLLEVKGLEKTAGRLRELAAPGQQGIVEQVLTPQYLSDLVAARYRVLFGETIGRPAMPGSTWTVTNSPGSFVASRKVTVERQEVCGTATCARLRVDFKVDPHVMAESAVALVRSSVQASGGDPSKVTVKNATYGMSGAMLTEPSTMLSHGASLAESGTVTVASPGQPDVTVELKGITELAYAYGTQVAGEPPTPTKSLLATD